MIVQINFVIKVEVFGEKVEQTLQKECTGWNHSLQYRR